MHEDDSPAMIDGLLAALADGDLRETVSDRLARLRARLSPDGPDLAARDVLRLLEALSAGLEHEALQVATQRQRGQFRQMSLRQALSDVLDLAGTGRVHGHAAALNLAFARALAAAPRRHQRALFDPEAYLAAHPDLAAAGVDALAHYTGGGASEGRIPGNLRLQWPQVYGDTADPETLEGLLQRPRPSLPEAIPVAVRDAALARAGAAGRQVSVILPTWNRAHTLRNAVESALLQSVPPLEVIVADDGSTDGTAQMVEAAFGDRISGGQLRLLRLPHAGVSAARNAALAAARGDTIAYLDSDNAWEPDHLLYAGLGLDTAPCAYTALNRHNLTHGWSDVLFRPFDRAALEQENYVDLNAFIHHRSLTDRIGGFDEALTRLVDWDMILRLTSDGHAVAVPVVTAHHVVDDLRLANISATVPIEHNHARIRAKLERHG